MAKEEKQAEELVPCPFCGGEAKIEYDYYDSSLYWVQCVNCSSVTNTFLTKAEAITAWETRTDTQRDELLEALKKYGKHLPNCMTLCEEDLSGMCDCGFTENKVRCQECKKVFSVRGNSDGICPKCKQTEQANG